jgi:FtsH-binding integral membrane protein
LSLSFAIFILWFSIQVKPEPIQTHLVILATVKVSVGLTLLAWFGCVSEASHTGWALLVYALGYVTHIISSSFGLSSSRTHLEVPGPNQLLQQGYHWNTMPALS